MDWQAYRARQTEALVQRLGHILPRDYLESDQMWEHLMWAMQHDRRPVRERSENAGEPIATSTAVVVHSVNSLATTPVATLALEDAGEPIATRTNPECSAQQDAGQANAARTNSGSSCHPRWQRRARSSGNTERQG